MITRQLLAAIRDGYALDWHGLHGVRPWARVYETGLRLAAENGARPAVVQYFAVFHDSRRLNEGRDDGHRARGARLAEEFRGRFYEVGDEDFALLMKAFNHSSQAMTLAYLGYEQEDLNELYKNTKY